MSQTTEVLDYIETHGNITPSQAWEELKIMRLAARIADLKKAGIEIETVIHQSGKTRWAEYKKPLPVSKTEERQAGEAVEGSDFASKNNTSNT